MSGKEKIKRHSVRTKGFSVWCLPELIKIPGDRYQYELEVLLKFYSGKGNEVDIQTLYFDQNRKTSFRPLIDSLLVYSVFLKYCIGAFIITVIDFLLMMALLPSKQSLIWFVAIRIFTTHLYFIIMKVFTFNNNHIQYRQIIKFYCLVIFNIITATVLFEVLYFSGRLHLAITYLLVAVLLFFLNFKIQKYLIFAK